MEKKDSRKKELIRLLCPTARPLKERHWFAFGPCMNEVRLPFGFKEYPKASSSYSCTFYIPDASITSGLRLN